jgi:hypothetical protein
VATATPKQIARVLAEAERTGITVQWLSEWYRCHFNRSLFEMDTQTAKAILTYVPYWPTRTGLDHTP